MINNLDDLGLKSSIIAGFDNVLFQAYKNALEKGNRNAMDEIQALIQRLLMQALSNSSPEVLHQLVFLPRYIYQLLQRDTNYKYVIERFGVFFTTSSYLFKYKADEGTDNRISELTKKAIEKYYQGFLALIHGVFVGEQNNLTEKLLEQFNQMTTDIYTGRWEIVFALQQNQISIEEAIIQKEELREANFPEVLHRQASLVLLSWAMVLFEHNKIDEETLLLIDHTLNVEYHYIEDLLEDVILIRRLANKGFLGVDNWDYEERPSGKIYSPPSAPNWVLHGLCGVLFRKNTPSFVVDIVTNDNDFRFLHDAVKEQAERYKKEFAKWSYFFGYPINIGNENSNSFEERVIEILAILEALRLRYEVSVDGNIMRQDLDKTIIDQVSDSVAEKWWKECTVYDIFRHYGNLTICKSKRHLTLLGVKYLLPRSRRMFVSEGAEHIYGLADIGAQVGRRTNNTFLERLLSNWGKDIPASSSLINGLEDAIAKLRIMELNATLIIIPPEFTYRNDLTNSEHFTYAIDKQVLPFPVIGYYKNIPVITFYSNKSKDQFVVTDFRKAFKMFLYENEALVNNVLHVKIRDLTPEEIEEKFVLDGDAWKKDEKGSELTDAEAKLRIATSVIAEIWSWARCTIADTNACYIGKITQLED